MSALTSYMLDFAYSISNCVSCFPASPQLKINGRSFKILRLLGEGGFSYVYLCQAASADDTGDMYAVKKIRCPFGQESVSQALREVEAYSLFAPHANIIHSFDHSVTSDRSDPGAKTVYILLPYYRRGNLQDIINANLVNHTRFPERRLMTLLLGVCKALKALHEYKKDGLNKGKIQNAKKVRQEAVIADLEAADDVDAETAPSARRKRDKMRAQTPAAESEQDPLMEDILPIGQDNLKPDAIRAYAHRDIKPANIMIADDGRNPILMDLGSLSPSPIHITNRSVALAVQDTAGEHSTLPYRAPELFDVKTDSSIDTKVDIWSLGCTIYACLVGKSPFEARSDETGGSLTMCILGGDWRWPDESGPIGGRGKARSQAQPQDVLSVSDGVKNVVRRCLMVEPSERPDIDELMRMCEHMVAGLPADDGED